MYVSKVNYFLLLSEENTNTVKMESAYDEDTYDVMDFEVAEDVCISFTLAINRMTLSTLHFISKTKICKIRDAREPDYNSSLIKDSNLDSNNRSIPIIEFKFNVVLDTNIFISNINELDELSQRYSKQVLFSVPYLIIQELDKLKSRPDDKSFLATKAQNAIKFIFNLLNQNRNFLFETSFRVCFTISYLGFLIFVVKIKHIIGKFQFG